MLGSRKRGVGGLEIDAKVDERVQIIFKKIFGKFLDGGGHTSNRRVSLFGMRRGWEVLG
jgi:hypothetical protein